MCCGTFVAQAQKSSIFEKQQTVKMEARSFGDSVVLRWNVDDAAVWMIGNVDGWRITRTGGKKNQTKVVKVVKPWDVTAIKSAFGVSDIEAGALAQSLYAPSKVPQTLSNDASTMIEYVCRLRDEQAGRKNIVEMIADRRSGYADAAGLRYVDRDVEEGVTYEYTISYAGKCDVFDCREVSQIVKNNPFKRDRLEKMSQVSVKQIGVSNVVVYWAETNHSGYYLERSLRGAGVTDTSWHALNLAPIVKIDKSETAEYPYLQVTRENVVYIDSLLPGQQALYRVRGYDWFAMLSEWSVSEPFTMLESRPLDAIEMTQLLGKDSNTVELSWCPVENVAYSGFVVAFSRSYDGMWLKVSDKLKPTETSFLDTIAAKRGIGYYRIYAFDTLGRLSCSNIMPNLVADLLAQTAPQGLRANASLVRRNIDGLRVNSGHATVSISWNAFDKEKSRDMIGCLVYASDKKEGPYSQVSPSLVKGNTFTDTVSVEGVSAMAYYYVVSVDNRFNTSSPSDTVSVQLPDIVPPEPCALKSSAPSDTKTVIKWHRSTSSDVVKYNVYSQAAGTSNWQWVATIDTSELGVAPYVTYNVPNESLIFPLQYAVEAIDHSGNSSGRGGEVSVASSPTARAGVKLKAKYNKKSSSVALSWQYAAKPQANFFGIIYRAVDGGTPVAVGSFKPTQTAFTDSRLPQGKNVSYHVVLKSSRTAVSQPSMPVRVALR